MRFLKFALNPHFGKTVNIFIANVSTFTVSVHVGDWLITAYQTVLDTGLY